MSNIQKQLAAATEVEPSKRKNEEPTSQDYMKRLAVAVGELSDDEWGKLSKDAQDWYNSAADALKLGQEIPAYQDMAPAATTTRRRTAAAEPAPYEPAVGQKVAITTKRGKSMEGTIAELDKDGLVLDDGTELDHDKIATISLLDEGSAGAAEPEGPKDPAVGDTVQVETARGKVIMGNISSMDGDDLVLVDGTGEEHELTKSKLKSIVVKVPAASGGRGAAISAKDTPKPAETKPAADDKPKRVTANSNGGVSATQRMRELICADMAAKKEDIAALLKKESLEFKQATLDLIYSDSHKLIGILRDLKKLK
jgi:hypothetical protein